MYSNHRKPSGRNSLYAFPSSYLSSHKSVELMNTFSHRDLALAKQKEKIKHLKEKINNSNQLNQIESNNDVLNAHNALLQKKMKIIEHERNELIKENKALKNIVNDKTKAIENFEMMIKESQDRYEKLFRVNDSLRKAEAKNQKNIKVRSNDIEQKTNDNIIDNNANVNSNHTKALKYSSSCNEIELLKLSNKNQMINQHINIDNQKLYQEINKLKNQIKDIQMKFTERIDEKNKALEKLSKERRELITEIDHISKDKEILSERLYTQNDNECNEIQTLKNILNDMNTKERVNDDKYTYNLNKLNLLISEKDKPTQDLKQKGN